MADPATWMIVGTVASTVAAAGGQYLGQQANEAAAHTKAQIDNAQADAMDKQASQELAAANVRASEQKRRADILTSTERARYAAGGGGMGGSAAEVIDDATARGEYNQELELWQGSEQARAQHNQAIVTRAGGEAGIEGADNARAGTYLNMAGTVLSGGGKLAGAMPVSTGSNSALIDVSYDPESKWLTSTSREVPAYRYSADPRYG